MFDAIEYANDLYLSDLHKDVCGFRPDMGRFATWSKGAIDEFVDQLIADLEVQIAEDKAREAKALAQYEAEIAELRHDHGITRKDAVRWMVQSYDDASAVPCGQDAEHYLWLRGIGFADMREHNLIEETIEAMKG
jgi:hypothetical protein